MALSYNNLISLRIGNSMTPVLMRDSGDLRQDYIEWKTISVKICKYIYYLIIDSLIMIQFYFLH